MSVSIMQYFVTVPTFMNLFPIYSFCNMHDISWGTKQGNLQAEQRRMHVGEAERERKKLEKAKAVIARMNAQVNQHATAEEAVALLAITGREVPKERKVRGRCGGGCGWWWGCVCVCGGGARGRRPGPPP